MSERILHLTDGSTVSAKVNFGTLQYMQDDDINDQGKRKTDTSLYALMAKAHKIESSGKPLPQHLQYDIAASMIYVILRSNGKKVTRDEAMRLVPLDISEQSEFMGVFEDFVSKLEDYSKKQEATQEANQYIKTV